MAQFDVVDNSGKKVSAIELSDAIFGIKPNAYAVHTAVVNFLANQRTGTHSTKTRAEVSGGGRKPWRQKGTGRARQGSTRSPQWTHGGVALGPKPRDYSYSINKKLKRLALCSALSQKAKDGKIVVVDEYGINTYKTKVVVSLLSNIGVDEKSLIVTPLLEKTVVKSAANIPGVKTTMATTLNVYDVVNAKTLILSVDAVKKIEEVFAPC